MLSALAALRRYPYNPFRMIPPTSVSPRTGSASADTVNNSD